MKYMLCYLLMLLKKINLSNKGIASAISAYNKVFIINNTFSNNSAAVAPIDIDDGEGCLILNNTFINNNARSLAQSMWLSGNNMLISGNTFFIEMEMLLIKVILKILIIGKFMRF